MAIRIVSAGTTIVKKVTVGTPNKIGDPSVGRVTALDDVNGVTNLTHGTYIRYDSDLGKFIHTGFDSDARNLISADVGLSYDPSTGQIVHTNSGVTSGTYGTASLIPTISVNDLGHIDSIGTVSVAGVSTFTFDSDEATLNIGTADGGSFNARIGLSHFTTDDLAEGNKLYFTENRVDSAILDVVRTQDVALIDSANGNRITNISQTVLANGRPSTIITSADSANSILVLSNQFGLTNPAGVKLLETFGDSGHIELYYNGQHAIDTTSYGVRVFGQMRSDSAQVIGNLNVDGITSLDSTNVVGDLNVTGDLGFTGDLAVTGNATVTGSILYQNVFATEGDLPNASTYHGMFAHVHASGKGYFSHGGSWHKLLDETTSTTTDLTEGTNLYYTRARRDSDLGNVGVDLLPLADSTYDLGSPTKKWKDLHLSGNSIFLGTITLKDSNGQLSVSGSGGTAAVNLSANTTSDLNEGSNLYYLTSRADSDFDVRLATKSTTDLSEGSNLYYTTARNDSDTNAYIAGNRTYGNITTTGYIAGPANLTIDPAGVGDNTGKVIIAGDLQVDGTQTIVNSTTVSINDKNIILADSAADSAAANGAGITVEGANALIQYNATTDTWDLNKPLGSTRNHLVNFSTTNLSEGSNQYYTKVRVDSDVNQGFADRTTTNLAEGSNLYYTTARADSDAKNSVSVTDNGGDGSLTYTPATGVISYTGPSATETRAHFSGGTGITYTSGTGEIKITDTTVIAGTYGSASLVPVFTVNAQGQVDSIGTVSVAGVSSTSFDSASGIFTINTADGGVFPTTILDSDLTKTRTRNVLGAEDAGGDGSFAYDSARGVFTYTGPSASEVRAHFSAGGDLSYNSGTGEFSFNVEDVYTKANFDSDFNTAIDEAALGGVGLDYNSTTNTLRIDSAELSAYALPIRSYFSAAGDLSYNNTTGEFSFDVESVYTQANFDSDFNTSLDNAALGGTGLSYAADSNTLSITNTGVTPASYGSASLVPVLAINAQGQVTSASTVSVAGVSSTSFDSASGIFTINTADGGTFNTTILDSDLSASRARDVVRAVDAGGDGSFAYDSASGTFTYTGPSASETRAHFSGGNGIEITNGKVDMDSAYDAVFNTATITTGEIYTTPTETSVTDNSATVVDTEAHGSDFKSIEYVVHMDDDAAGHSQISKLLLTYNKTNVFYSEYGMVSSFTGDSDIGTLTADVSGSDIRLIFTRASGMGTISVKPVKTVIS